MWPTAPALWHPWGSGLLLLQDHGTESERSFEWTYAMNRDEIKAAWKTRRNRVYLSLVVTIAAMAYLVWSLGVEHRHLDLSERPPDAVIAAFVLLAIGCMFSLVTWRCPSCGKSPTPWGQKRPGRFVEGINPIRCMHCGAELRSL